MAPRPPPPPLPNSAPPPSVSNGSTHPHRSQNGDHSERQELMSEIREGVILKASRDQILSLSVSLRCIESSTSALDDFYIKFLEHSVFCSARPTEELEAVTQSVVSILIVIQKARAVCQSLLHWASGFLSIFIHKSHVHFIQCHHHDRSLRSCMCSRLLVRENGK